MAQALSLSVAKPPDLMIATGGEESPADFSADGSHDLSPRDVCSEYEQSAAAALLGLHSAWPSSPDEEGRDDDAPPVGLEAAERLWDCAAAGLTPGYGSPSEFSPTMGFRRHFDYDTPGYPSPKRMRAPKDGAPPPGTSRFRCKYPGCRKLYASTDAVRKHCRKRHLEWLRQIDRFSAHERGTPKPALYCVWGDDEMRL